MVKNKIEKIHYLNDRLIIAIKLWFSIIIIIIFIASSVLAQLVSQARIVKLTSMTAYHQHSVTRVSAVMVSTISLVSVTVDSQERFVT